MNWPLGNSVGNAIEINECVNFMKSPDTRSRLYQAVSLIAGEMYGMTGNRKHIDQTIQDSLQSGRVYEKFLQMVSIQGGDISILEKGLSLAPVYLEAKASRDGYVQFVDIDRVGILLNEMGGGRKKMSDSIDHGVGLEFCIQPGERVEQGTVMVKFWVKNEEDGERVLKEIGELVQIGEERVEFLPLCRDKILSD